MLIEPSETEQQHAVNKMQQYISSLPVQESFKPPLLPMITLADADVKNQFSSSIGFYSNRAY